MNLHNKIEILEGIKNNQSHQAVTKRLDEIIDLLKDLNVVTEMFDKKFGKSMFYVEKINNVPWLCYNKSYLCMLTNNQAKSIERIING